MLRSHSRRDDAVRITTAPTSAADDLASRQRRYLISMSIRVVCVVGAVVLAGTWLMWICIVGAVVLPYVAVVMANVSLRGEGSPLEPMRYDELPPVTRHTKSGPSS